MQAVYLKSFKALDEFLCNINKKNFVQAMPLNDGGFVVIIKQ